MIIGHVLWEFGVILVILVGFGRIILGNDQIIYLAGGFVLALMGVQMIRSRTGEIEMERSRVSSSLGGGIFYSAFNPTQPVWYHTHQDIVCGQYLAKQFLHKVGFIGEPEVILQ